MSVVEKAISEFPFGDRNLLVSCSGGIDSIVLLHAIIERGLKPEVVHINYQLRGKESDLDQKLVEKTALDLGLKCAVYYCPTELTKGKGINLQSAARDFRRQIYADWISADPKNAVVLAHHADDQVETFFLQFFRGSGSLGFGGMFEDKKGILRPLLSVSRKEILEYAKSKNIEWREDQSNQSTTYIRNLFRNKLLPELKKENSSLAESVLLLMEKFRDQREENLLLISKLLDSWNLDKFFSISDWHEMEEDQKPLFLYETNLPFWMKDRIHELIDGNGSQKLAMSEGNLVKDGEYIRLVKNDKESTWDFKIEEVEILPEVFSKDEIYLDGALFDIKDVSLVSWQIGDRIKSIGMSGSQLVSNILKDAGVPEWKKSTVPVLKIAGEIVWIPGFKVSRKHIASQESRNKFKITIC